MSYETFARELADLHPISFNFEALTKEIVIEKVQNALQVCSLANVVIIKLNDMFIKYVEKKLETVASKMEDADAPAPVSFPRPASDPVFTVAKKFLASIVKTTQPINVKQSDNDVVVASKTEMTSKANEALKKVNVWNYRVTNKDALVVEVSSENDKGNAFSRLKDGFSNSYVVEGA